MILSLTAFATLAASCGAAVHPDTLAAVARAESGFNTLAIGDNTTRRSHAPATIEEAIAVATALLREGRSVDLGLMQINSANLFRLGMTVADAFDPCRSIAAGARVLVDGYRRPGAGDDAQAAVLRALSHYNTGHPRRGFDNGYVMRVQGAAEVVVPAIRLRGETAGVPQRPAVPPTSPSPDNSDAPPDWDVWARAAPASRPHLVAVPRQASAASGGAAEAALTAPPESPE